MIYPTRESYMFASCILGGKSGGVNCENARFPRKFPIYEIEENGVSEWMSLSDKEKS